MLPKLTDHRNADAPPAHIIVLCPQPHSCALTHNLRLSSFSYTIYTHRDTGNTTTNCPFFPLLSAWEKVARVYTPAAAAVVRCSRIDHPRSAGLLSPSLSLSPAGSERARARTRYLSARSLARAPALNWVSRSRCSPGPCCSRKSLSCTTSLLVVLPVLRLSPTASTLISLSLCYTLILSVLPLSSRGADSTRTPHAEGNERFCL